MTSTLVRSTDTLAGLARELDAPGGGFTFDVWTMQPVTSGYAVAVVRDAEQQIQGPVTRDDVVAYALRHAPTLRRPGMRLGGWRDGQTGIAYLDISCVVATREEARALAEEHAQLAFFDLNTGSEIYL